MKIASLLPAATEILCALGAEDSLVGVSHECDYPAGVARLPALTRPRLAVDGDSLRIHDSMTELVEKALAVYEVEVERLRALQPELVLTQDLCDVCAVSYDDVCTAVRALSTARVVTLHPARLDDLYRDIREVGEAAGRAAEAAHRVEDLQARLQRLSDRAGALPRRTVLLLEWLQPVMVGGLWSADLAAAAGADALASQAGEYARTLNRNELAALDPDAVVIKPCGFALERGLAELPRLPEYLPWEEWRAVRSDRVFLVDGNAYFNRSGPRLVDSAEILAACVHEGAFGDFRARYAGAVRRVNADLSIGALHD